MSGGHVLAAASAGCAPAIRRLARKGADLNEKDQVELRCSPFLSEEKLFDVAFDARRSFLRRRVLAFDARSVLSWVLLSLLNGHIRSGLFSYQILGGLSCRRLLHLVKVDLATTSRI